MGVSDWKYYHGAAISALAPHLVPDSSPLESGEIWQGGVLFARWTSDFDCGREGEWWYVIKDTPFDPGALKAKRRYEITKGARNFTVRRIKASAWQEELWAVQSAAQEKYTPGTPPTKEEGARFKAGMADWDQHILYAAFSREDDRLCGFALLIDQGRCLDFAVLKADPAAERLGVNAALIAHMLGDQTAFLTGDGYISDGARSIHHATAIQDYLEKYFGFRRAYCRLHMRYRPRFSFLVRLAYPFRRLLRCFDRIGIVHKINAILQMEEICRRQS